jgi:hypothetical protein
VFFFACPRPNGVQPGGKKNQKKIPAKDYMPFAGLFPG